MAAVKRRLAKIRRDALNFEAFRAERRAMFGQVNIAEPNGQIPANQHSMPLEPAPPKELGLTEILAGIRKSMGSGSIDCGKMHNQSSRPY